MDSIVGNFINLVTLKAEIDDDMTVAQFIKIISKNFFKAIKHQDYPFTELVGKLNPVRNHDIHPIFQTIFNFQNSRKKGGKFLQLWHANINNNFNCGDHEISPFPLQESSANGAIGLTLEVIEIENSLRCDFKYDSELFSESTIRRITECYTTLLAHLIGDDQQRIVDLNILPAAEREQVLVKFNDTAVDYPTQTLIHNLIEAQVNATPDAIALVYEQSTLSYAQLNQAANRVAHYLIDQGIGPDDRVGLLGILKAGAAYVPLDPSYLMDRLAYMLTDAAPRALLTQSPVYARLEELACVAESVALPVVMLDDTSTWAAYLDHNPDPAALGLTSRHLAYVIYTSGSSGQPKGVMNEHLGVVNRLL